MKKRRTDKFILNEQGEPVPEPDLMKWGHWFHYSRKERVVRQEWVANVWISTVFLGLDHGWLSKRPVLWETMCFSNDKRVDSDTRRCSGGREQAEAMHRDMVAEVKERLAGRYKKRRGMPLFL